MRLVNQWPLAAVIFTAAFFLADALWIPVKAELAQALMERAWERRLEGEEYPKPWPWADTSPVAILEVPRLGIRQFVLEGASGRNLAFGPASLSPVTGTDVVLSGHRDTHFAFLRDLREGDLVRLRLPHLDRSFLVTWREVIDSGTTELVLDHRRFRLTLTTCFPFDAPQAGGALRFLVTALPLR